MSDGSGSCLSQKTRGELAAGGLAGEIARKGGKTPIQAGQRWHVGRTDAWHNSFSRLRRCYERKEDVIGAFFDLPGAIITVRSLIRQAWTLYRWDSRPGEAAMITCRSARALNRGRGGGGFRRGWCGRGGLRGRAGSRRL
jgi:hypothetical protein